MIDFFIYLATVVTAAILHPIGSLIVGFAIAVGTGIIIKLSLNYYYRPRLYIDGNVCINVTEFHLLNPSSIQTKFWANRIRVRNAGKSAAKDCKAYVCYTRTNIRRAAWLIRNKESGYTQTLNIWDREFVDFCCISDDGLIRIIPPEHGYDENMRYDAYVDLEQKWGDITIRITSSNAKPVQRRVELHTTVDHFPKQRGRIVEFLDKDPKLDHIDDTLTDD